MSDAKQGEVLALTLVSEQDVFLVRQRGRQVAALAGLENQDQVRVATALSELGRELTVLKRPATVTWSLIGEVTPMLLMNASWAGPLPGVSCAAELATLEGVAAAARLTDTCDVGWSAEGGSVALAKRLPAGPPTPPPARLERGRGGLPRAQPLHALHRK